MRPTLNTITLGREIHPIRAFQAAAAAGFAGVGVWHDRLGELKQQDGSLAGLKVFTDRLHIEEMCYLGGWMWATGEAREKALRAAEERAALAAEIGCPVIVACASSGCGDPRQAAADFRAICHIGARYGVIFALEYIGAFEQYHDLKSGLELVRAADHPHGKLLIDIFHSFRGGACVEDFKLPHGDEIACVHLNDVPAGDITQMDDSDRILPGEGVLPVRAALHYLAENGYNGALSIELFNPELWALPPEETAARAKAAIDKLWK